jgi:mRNA-degrading endonuclease YafQ of YafQ-DinJ toxin-antitoxin module
VRRELLRSSAFALDLRAWIKTHRGPADEIAATLERLAVDAFDSSLKTHKLRGPRAGCWACSGGYDLRIIFEFTQHNGVEAILLLALGTHDQVY